MQRMLAGKATSLSARISWNGQSQLVQGIGEFARGGFSFLVNQVV
jgi:hypothetical protein